MTQLELPFDDDLAPEAASPGYLTIAEAAKIVRCHERTIRRAIERGALRSGRVRGANAARVPRTNAEPTPAQATRGAAPTPSRRWHGVHDTDRPLDRRRRHEASSQVRHLRGSGSRTRPPRARTRADRHYRRHQDNTLAALWPIYHADAVARLAKATIISYDRCWVRHLAPRFGDMPMDEITPRSVAQWRADMLAKGIGRETVRRAMVLLQAMFKLGVEWGEAERNPVSFVRKPRQGRIRAIEVLDPATVERLRRALLANGDHFSATLVSVLAYAGVRPGEGIALERRHIRKDTILVEQAVAYGTLKLQKTGRIYRTVDLLPELRRGHPDLVRHEGHHVTRRTSVRPERRRLDAPRRLEELAPPPLQRDDRSHRPRPPTSLRPAPLLRLADDPRRQHLHRRARRATRPLTDRDAEDLRPRLRRAPAPATGARERPHPGRSRLDCLSTARRRALLARRQPLDQHHQLANHVEVIE